VAGVLQKVIDKALQVHGGMGMTDDTIIAYFYRHERAARIYDGADEVHKMAVAKGFSGTTRAGQFARRRIRMEFTDRPTRVRQGEELDLNVIEQFLRKQHPRLVGRNPGRAVSERYSNLTYLIRAGDRELVLRRPPLAERPKQPMIWERIPHPQGPEPGVPLLPQPLVYTEDASIMGVPSM